ncbi:hypothetical protein HNR60_000658 [Rhodopseudomonas rhenobacensis]|uniref:Uncharacterized protein n=1 Tax=Rhodopseudomonas rhenobacensis TaxID=87461 RepID=A0A7W7Z0T0_9BRAD|nr:hypothetical protein [Rhodopseudomonas rhenobacensis]MBB5045923.1 hypothetical protein [Rhodopseudomonas rhenobacensis]
MESEAVHYQRDAAVVLLSFDQIGCWRKLAQLAPLSAAKGVRVWNTLAP